MAQLTIIYWRDIPAQVVVKAGSSSAKRQLSERFETAIDRAAMHSGLHGTDDYLTQWRRAAAGDVGEDFEAEAGAAVERLEAEYPEDRLKTLTLSGGIEEAGGVDAG